MFNALIDLLMAPFRSLPAEVGLVCFGAVTGLLVLLIFKATSNPARVVRARNRALSRVIELWLYRHDPLLGLRSIGWMLIDNLRYLATLLMPMICSLLPMLVLLAQGHDWFASRALRPGETMLVVAHLRPDAPIQVLNDTDLLVHGTSLALDAPPVRTPDWREVAWSVKRTQDGATGHLVIHTGDVELRKTADAAGGLARRSSCRTASFFDHLLYPGEARLAVDAPFDRIETRWPAAEYKLLGWRTDWFWGLLATSFVAGLILKKPLRVEF